MADILAFVKAAIAALLKLFGKELNTEAADEFLGNVGSAIEDVKDYGDSLIAG